ncbi:MAG TPA: formate dehydrogenase subunit alpha [Vicinamibacterales bacterium]|nr:formate dehydrogenase subunit alpha [Vicinamibacterales bacterium]
MDQAKAPGVVSTPATLHIIIDGVTHAVADGATVMEALRASGIDVPAMCHDERLVPSGACRACLVRVSGFAKPVTACTTLARDGMAVEVDTAELKEARASVLEMLVHRYPAEDIRRYPEKPFHRAIQAAQLADRAAATDAEARERRQDLSHPYIAVDMSRCIDCYRCVRICDEVQGQFVWHVRDRGVGTRVCPDGPNLRDSSCVGCGACVDTCPTGALEDRLSTFVAAPTEWTRSVCPYCGVGCELNVGTRAGHIVSIRPVLDSPVSKGHLCVKGRYAFGFVAAADRITEPMIRDGGAWRSVSWTDACAFVADRLQSLVRGHGPDSIGVLGSARATNEDNYVAQKFARAVIGTNNVDCCARVCHAPSAAALKRAFGAGLATGSFDDIEAAFAILVCGANATESHPIVGARIKQAARRGARLVVIDPRRIELAVYADVHLAIRPGTNIPLLNAMAQTIVSEGLFDRRFVDARASGFDEFLTFIQGWTPERAAAVCDVDPNAIRHAARLYASNTPAMSVHGLGLTEHTQGTDGVTALINLALLTGNVGKAGSGVNPLRGQNNVQGAAHMGCDPAVLAGSTPIDRGRQTFSERWGVAIPLTRGMHMLEMMDAAGDGRLKGLWCTGYDLLATNPNAAATARALAALDLLIVQDLFLTETAREHATVFLPACSTFEKDGTFMNAERRIQRVRAALAPAGSSKADWQIVCDVARAMGAPGFDYASARAIWDEIRDLCAGARGMTYERLETCGLQWPCPSENHPGTALLHTGGFATGPRAVLQPLDDHPTPEATSPAFPFTLVTGRSLYQFNNGTMTGRTLNNDLRPTDTLDVSAADANRINIADGDLVRITSVYGAASLPARVSDAMLSGQLYATFQRPDLRLNAVTGPYRDNTTGTPEYKVTAVRLEHESSPPAVSPAGEK